MPTQNYELRDRIEAVERAESDDNDLSTLAVPTDFEDGARFHERFSGVGALPRFPVE